MKQEIEQLEKIAVMVRDRFIYGGIFEFEKSVGESAYYHLKKTVELLEKLSEE